MEVHARSRQDVGAGCFGEAPRAKSQQAGVHWLRRLESTRRYQGSRDGTSQGIRHSIEKCATVVPIDEFRSSVTCSRCHRRLKKARLLTKMQRKEDEVDIRTKEQPSKKEVKEIEEMRKFRNPKLASMKIDRTPVHPERLALYQQSMQGKLLEPGRQRREEHAGAAEEWAKREARRKQAAGVQAGQPLRMVEPEHVSGKTGSHALQGNIATHVHTAEAQGDQLDSLCFILLITRAQSSLSDPSPPQ